MAAASRRTDSSLDQVLFEEGYRFDFFEAVRLLERLYPAREAVGRGATPEHEVVRFRTRISLSFPPSSIYEIDAAEEEDGPAEMTVAFMGLAGLMGVLPRHYTEMLLERMRQKDFTLRDFFDLFNHRFLSLFYRAWEKYRFPVAYERSVQSRDRYDPFSLDLFDLIGMGTGGLREQLVVDGETLLYYSGLLAQQPHSASALESLLGDFFGVAVRVQQFFGEWLKLPSENRARLTSRGDENGALGNAILGARFWDQQAKFRLCIGPMTLAQFQTLLPTEKGLRRLVQLTRLCIGQELDFDLQLILKASEVPSCRLGKADANGLRLGWSSWLKTREFARDADQAILGSHYTRAAKSAEKSEGARA
jgi:type VI secretion system protein ImpH